MKINISIDDDLLKNIDDYADSHYMSRSGFISFACVQHLQNENSARIGEACHLMARAVMDILQSHELSPEAVEKLQDFERLANLYFER